MLPRGALTFLSFWRSSSGVEGGEGRQGHCKQGGAGRKAEMNNRVRLQLGEGSEIMVFLQKPNGEMCKSCTD